MNFLSTKIRTRNTHQRQSYLFFKFWLKKASNKSSPRVPFPKISLISPLQLIFLSLDQQKPLSSFKERKNVGSASLQEPNNCSSNLFPSFKQSYSLPFPTTSTIGHSYANTTSFSSTSNHLHTLNHNFRPTTPYNIQIHPSFITTVFVPRQTHILSAMTIIIKPTSSFTPYLLPLFRLTFHTPTPYLVTTQLPLTSATNNTLL